jgi:putative transposase
MTYSLHKHHRRSIRLRDYDYTKTGAYFVTLCTYERACLFGEVVGDGVMLSEVGAIVQEEWLRSAEIRREIELDAFVVMPNHLHGIVVIEPVGAHGRAPLPRKRAPLQRKPKSLGSFIAGFKSACTKRINEIRGMPRMPLWQRNYYEHVIRSEEALENVRLYIAHNPRLWQYDVNNPASSRLSLEERNRMIAEVCGFAGEELGGISNVLEYDMDDSLLEDKGK